MEAAEPVETLHLFAPERSALLEVLAGLSTDQWAAGTVCAGWTVKDLAAHLIGDDLGILARWRDEYTGDDIAAHDWPSLVAAINERNEAWVEAMRRLSPQLLTELLRWTDEPVVEMFRGLNPDEQAGPVSWAGPGPAPRWLHVARGLTERWHHQQQIRDAVRAPSLDDPRFLRPVLATFVRALPRAYAGLNAPPETQLEVALNGPAGSVWTLVRAPEAWLLLAGPADDPVAVVTTDQETAWRLFTRGLPDAEVAERVQVDGDDFWRTPMLSAVAIIA